MLVNRSKLIAVILVVSGSTFHTVGYAEENRDASISNDAILDDSIRASQREKQRQESVRVHESFRQRAQLQEDEDLFSEERAGEIARDAFTMQSFSAPAKDSNSMLAKQWRFRECQNRVRLEAQAKGKALTNNDACKDESASLLEKLPEDVRIRLAGYAQTNQQQIEEQKAASAKRRLDDEQRAKEQPAPTPSYGHEIRQLAFYYECEQWKKSPESAERLAPEYYEACPDKIPVDEAKLKEIREHMDTLRARHADTEQ